MCPVGDKCLAYLSPNHFRSANRACEVFGENSKLVSVHSFEEMKELENFVSFWTEIFHNFMEFWRCHLRPETHSWVTNVWQLQLLLGSGSTRWTLRGFFGLFSKFEENPKKIPRWTDNSGVDYMPLLPAILTHDTLRYGAWRVNLLWL